MYSVQKFCSLNCANIYNNKKRTHNIALPKVYGAELAEFMGIVFGDGCVTEFSVYIYLNSIADIGYVPFVTKLASRLFPGASINGKKEKTQNVIRIQISSKIVSAYLKNIGFKKSREIPHWINDDKVLARYFIRGLFDTEGSISFKKYSGKNGNYLYKQLTFTNLNKNLLSFVIKELTALKLKSTSHTVKNLYISNPESIQSFVDLIGFSNPKLINKVKITNFDGYNIRAGRGPQKSKERYRSGHNGTVLKTV